MYFLIGGVQPKKVKLEKLDRFCSACSRDEVYRTRIDHYLSLFFIPLFPVKRGGPMVMCHHCGTAYDERGESRRFDPEGAAVCPECGGSLEPGFRYCPWCGGRL